MGQILLRSELKCNIFPNLLSVLHEGLQVELAELAVEHVALLALPADDVGGQVDVAGPHRRRRL